MGFPFLTTARRVQHGGDGTRLQQAMPRQKASRRRRFTGETEQLEVRALQNLYELVLSRPADLDIGRLF